MTYKKMFFTLFLAPLALLMCVAGWVLYYDSLQIFPKGYFIEEKYSSNMREQAKGIIDNVQFDSVILGTSMLENSSATEASQLLGTTFVNMSVSGSNFYERAFILDYLLKNKNITSVIYSFDTCYTGNEMYRTGQDNIWPLLYSSKFVDYSMIYYNNRMVRKAFKRLVKLHRGNNTKADASSFDRKNEWYTDPYHACRFGGLEHWIKNIEKQGIKKFLCVVLANVVRKLQDNEQVTLQYDEKLIDAAKKYIYINILQYVKNNSNTTFHLVIPPYYRYRYASTRQVNTTLFTLHQEVVRYLVKESSKLTNIKIYGFEDMDFLDKIENYKDTSHYHYSINSMMTHAIANGEHILTPENIDAYLAKCDQLAQNFDIVKFYNDACDIMREQGIDPKTGKKL